MIVVERHLAHHHEDPRLHDHQLVEHASGAGLGGVDRIDRALHADRAVDRERVDAKTLERLLQGHAGASVESDALLDLGGLCGMLDQEDVGLRVAAAEHRHQVAARALVAVVNLVRERVELADRPVEIFLADLVVCAWHLVRHLCLFRMTLCRVVLVWGKLESAGRGLAKSFRTA